MKTIKILISVTLVALATTSFGQRGSMMEKLLHDGEILYEAEMGLENWMTIPFENTMTEEEFPLEPWMTSPFEVNGSDNELSLEPWMSAPFETTADDEELHLEAWMIAAIWE